MQINRSILVPYSDAQMFDVVADIEQYSDFLHWCDETTVLAEEDDQVDAQIKVSFKKLKLSFTTRNINAAPGSIQMQLLSGPFSRLQGTWRFERLAEKACKVSLSLQFEFENRVTQAMFSGLFEQVIVNQISAFEKRAKQLYG